MAQYVINIRKVYDHSTHQIVTFKAKDIDKAYACADQLAEYYGGVLGDEVEWEGMLELDQ